MKTRVHAERTSPAYRMWPRCRSLAGAPKGAVARERNTNAENCEPFCSIERREWESVCDAATARIDQRLMRGMLRSTF
jgi:hypothetical protein